VRDEDKELSLPFDGLVIANGAVPREWPGGQVPNGVLMLRTVEDCLAIRERLRSRPRVVVVGGGFIGAEVAASCRTLGLDVVLIEKATGPLLAALGKELAPRWAELHRRTASTCELAWVSTHSPVTVGSRGFDSPMARTFRPTSSSSAWGLLPPPTGWAVRDCVLTTA
jgi:NADH dehydrogenase FAD-containing subunit